MKLSGIIANGSLLFDADTEEIIAWNTCQDSRE